MKRWIVSADDFAFNDAVDDGILALIGAGVVTATSCLTRSPRWCTAARRLDASVRARADVGIHIDLTEFESVLPNHAALALACYTRSIDGPRLRAVLRTQFERFEEALASAPDYIDGHRHVHQLPVVREVLIDLLTERYPGRMPWVRISRAGGRAGWKGSVITSLGSDGLYARCCAAGVATNAHLLGFYDFIGNAASYRERLSTWLAAAADRDVLMCHPASRLAAGDRIAAARLAEFQVLSSPWWTECLGLQQLRSCRGTQCLSH